MRKKRICSTHDSSIQKQRTAFFWSMSFEDQKATVHARQRKQTGRQTAQENSYIVEIRL